MTLPGSFGVDLASTPMGRGPEAASFARASSTPDARVDDARLVVRQRDGRARARRRHPRAHATRRRRTARRRRLWRATLEDAEGAAARSTAQSDRQRRRALGRRRCATLCNGCRRAEQCAPRQGQPHRRAARASEAPRVHPAERRQPDRVRDSLPGALFADRHDGHRRRRITSIRRSRPTRSSYLLELANTYLARAARRKRRRLDLQRRAPALRRRLRRTRPRSRATTCSSSTPARGGGAPLLSIYGGKITTYRKLAEQALDRARAVPAAAASRGGRARAALPGGDLPSAGSPRGSPELSSALSGTAGRDVRRRSRAATEHARRRFSATRRRPRDLGADFGHGLTAARG